MNQTIILGAGIAGLAAAHSARQRRADAVVFEAATRAGGLLDSFELDGWRFDNGVHLSFASEPEVRAVFDRTPSIEHDAVSFAWDDGYWLRHPVQNNLYPLPPDQKADLIAALTERPQLAVDNYRNWLVSQYGEKIAARWPLAYTRKYWTIAAERMGTDWIGNRMRQSDIREVLFGAMSPESPNTYYLSRMRYPRRGGYRAFIEPLMEHADVRTGHRAVLVDWKARRIHFANGVQHDYRQLISTIPLPELIRIMPDVPEAVAQAASTLFATSMDLISIGLGRASVAPSLWFYIYDEDILASRVYSPSAKAPENAPAGCSSLQFEIYSSVHRPLAASVAGLKENCLHALEKMGLAKRDDVLFMHHKNVPYANVVFDLGMEQRRDLVRDWVRERGIVLAGRFGEWDYLWSNQSFMSGVRAAGALG